MKELLKLIEDCCNDIFYRLEPLANVKSRLYVSLKPAINYTHCCESDIEQLVCGCGKNKPVRREPAYLHCDWCGSITEETK